MHTVQTFSQITTSRPLAHLSVHQKLNGVSSVQLRRSVCALKRRRRGLLFASRSPWVIRAMTCWNAVRF